MSPVSPQTATPPREVKSDASIDLEKVPVDQALAQLAVKPDRGLSSAEAPQRLNKYGPNALIWKENSVAPPKL